ncbi:hypothetical protein BJ912DRAFT_1020231 [Pholiota molesta]|nr:hypothetical protein BJ912DRAFT_1020231 [Pholiota molesta]
MSSTNLNGSPRKSLWKGKSKATEEDFDDLNPVITYRHILSQNLGVRDPLRMNRLGIDQDTPLVVLQWDALIAVNYPARKFGISRMDRKKDALKRCPHLKVVHVATYKEGEKEPGIGTMWIRIHTRYVSLDYYRRESMKIAALFKEKLPGCEIEKASIDEAFIDFTKPIREILAGASEGPDTPLPPPPPIVWDNLGCLIPVNPPPPPPEEKPASDGNANCLRDLPETACSQGARELPITWHDVALSIGAELMGTAREAVRLQLGYTTSAVRRGCKNKFLAKLTASYKKFNSQSILRNAAIPNYLKPMQFQRIVEEMQSKFGENSVWVYEVLRVYDFKASSSVKDKGSTLTKSMLASKNLPKPITKASEGYHWIRVLAAELALRLRDAREISPNLWPKTLVLHARKGYEAGRSKQAPFPFTRDLTDKLWKELVGNTSTLNVTSVQLAFTGIDTAEAGQSTIEGFLKPASSKKRARDFPDLSELSFICSRCGKKITVPTIEYPNGNGNQEDILMKAKMEHDDFHFAQDLAHDGQPQTTSSEPKAKSKPMKKRKVPPEPKGIEKFFRK